MAVREQRVRDASIWFPGKRYGWGWGLPVHPMGWVTLAVYVAGVVGLSLLFPPHRVGLWGFYGVIAVPTAALLVVCLLKGERPRWRWGK